MTEQSGRQMKRKGADRRARSSFMADERKTADMQNPRPEDGPKAKPEETTPASAAKRQAGDRDTSAPPTEQAPPSRKIGETSQYVITVQNNSGVCTKVERLDDQTGEKTVLYSGGSSQM